MHTAHISKKACAQAFSHLTETWNAQTDRSTMCM